MLKRDHYPFCSVVICSRGRHGLLLQAVESVLRSSYPKERYEIIVLEEGATPDPVSGVNYIYLPLKNLGLGYSRNQGVKNAKGDIVVFTDDDVIVDENWLGEMAATFDDPDVYGAAGLTRAQRGSAAGEVEEILGVPGGGIKALAASGGKTVPTVFISTCNAAYRSIVFKEFSFMETSFGKFGGEDWYLARQVSQKYKTVYNPKALVFHKPKGTPARLIHTFYRRQINEYLSRQYIRGESKFSVIFGKPHRSLILRFLAALAAVCLFKLPGLLFVIAAYYFLSLYSIYRLWPYVENKNSFFLYPIIKFITEVGILKGELFVLFASEKTFDKILEKF